MFLNLGDSVIDIKDFNSNNQINKCLKKCDLGQRKLGNEIDNVSINGDNLHLQFMDKSPECLNIFTRKKQFVTHF